jgi:hypothetical protein
MQAACGSPAVTMAARSPIAIWAHEKGLLAGACSLDAIDAHLLYQPDAELSERSIRFLRSFDRVLSYLGGPNEAVSERLGEVCTGAVVAIDPRPCESTARDGRHITRQWADELNRRGWPILMTLEPTPVLAEQQQATCRGQLRERLDSESDPVALCHPGSGGLKKCCPIDVLERIMAKLAATGWKVAWMIGPDEIERFGEAYVQQLEETAPAVFEESTERAADLVCGADGYIGHDAGMTHLATLVGVRTVAIFGPTDPRVWRPLGASCRIVGFPDSDGPSERWLDQIVAWLVGRRP